MAVTNISAGRDPAVYQVTVTIDVPGARSSEEALLRVLSQLVARRLVMEKLLRRVRESFPPEWDWDAGHDIRDLVAAWLRRELEAGA